VTRSLPEVAQLFLAQHHLRETGLVLAVSGGADSVALLRALADTPSIVAHLNHKLRGAASDADEAFVRGLAATHRLPFVSVRIDVASQADNLEQTARDIRYRWLSEVAHTHGLRHVATAHNADDQAETVLHRLLRGTGLQGLRGIAARRTLEPGIEVIRPLLSVRRAEIVAYLAELGQPFQVDETNSDVRYTRNRLRHELLPLLERDYNPETATLLCRLADQADEAYREGRMAAEQLLALAERPRSARLLVFDVTVLRAATGYRVREMFRLLWEREGWPISAMNFERWKALEAVVNGDVAAVDLPGRYRVRQRGNVVLVGPIGN